MIRSQFLLDVHPEIFIDNFAGGGGASAGYELATGRHVDHAINHDAFALGMHRINHPQTVHHHEDMFDVCPVQLAGGRRIGGAWFSPDCTHFSKAKGGKPLNKKIRGLCLVMLRYAAARARVMYMENVEEIQTWGPLLRNGQPDPRYRGRTWRAFLDALGPGVAADHPDLPQMLALLNRGGAQAVTKEQLVHGFGYQFEHREIRASNLGVHTIRKRLFLICRCDGRPIVWPKQTHFDPKVLADGHNGKAARRGMKPWKPVAECIDWDRPCPSIFLNKRQARKVKCKRPLAKATLRRVATGIGRYVIHAAEPFIVQTETVTNGAFVTEHANGTHQRNFAADEPMRTQMAHVKGGHFALVAGAMVQRGHYKSNSAMVKGANEPMRTQATNGEHGLIAAHLTKFNTGSVGNQMTQPAPTIVSGSHSPKTHGGAASTLGLVAANLVEFHSPKREGDERNKPVTQPLLVQSTEPRFGLVATSLVKMRGTSDAHISASGKSAGHPIETLSAAGTHHALSACYLAQHNAGGATNPGHAATEPLSTLSSKGSQQQIVSASIAAYYGSEADGQPVTDSLRTVSTKPRFGLAQCEAVAPVMTEEQIAGAHRVAKFLRRHGVEFEGEFATVAGFVIWDIGIRMLTPRELFRAQGFGESYVIDRAWLVDPKTGEIKEVKLTKEQQIRMCGNSVCPPVAAAIVAANSADLGVWAKGERRRVLRERAMAA